MGETGRTPPVDFCNRCDPRARPRPPELCSTPPAVARWCSSLSTGITFRRCGRAADGKLICVSRPVEVPRVRGQLGARRPHVGSSHRDRSRWKLCPNPIVSDTPCRKPVTIRRPETPTSSGAVAPATSLPRCPDARAPARPGVRCRGPFGIGPPHPPSREGERGPLHPRCLPSPDRPPFWGGLAPPSTGCPQSVD
jgi:hypothetical protein